ncbi:MULTISPECIES: glycoside hydrolase family 2 protein [unclassified Oceanispirochaeta]|uniref:glycoside hydrolase family 2 protein n=1 Tax=unclassified Oceanispirochaeta TaxID=2635722 RepID=UPI001313DFFA|nr:MULTISPECIES: glycoside hydrolase family 2 TIM barrel-domain containing protein [unclassified Oceanispirochaeta]MBF9017884.1 hypothetical protein [Oceanispirochaeta sp. M2]NPD74395.1 hypothetical protein [Oceanispirochaeta sp. M1]
MPVLILLFIPALLILFFASIFLFYPHLNYSKMPVAKGAQGDQFEVRSLNGIPYLLTNNLPYSTHFEESRRARQSLAGEWMFRTDPENRGLKECWFTSEKPDGESSDWEQTAVPSVFNAASGERTSYAGFCWYRKIFKRDSVPEGFWSRLCFEGVLLRSEVYLNGHKLCEREGGYTPFFLNASDHLKVDEDNVLVLRVDNRSNWESIPPLARKEHNPGWHMYGGIYRDVYFETVPENYIFKAVARTLSDGDKTVLGLDVLVHAPDSTCRIDVSLIDPEGNSCGGTLLNAELDSIDQGKLSSGGAVRGGHCDLILDNPLFWNPGDPALYTVLIETASAGHSDRVSFKTGLKSIEIENEKILFNGESLFLKGISKHEDDPELGSSQTEESLNRDLGLVEELGANYIRTAHYPHDVREMLSIRDRGLLCSEEIPMYQTGTGFTAWFEEKQSILRFPAKVFGMHQMNYRPLLQNAQKQLIEMIERDINNPAILFWSAGNECYTLFKNGGRVFGWLRSVAKAFDPSRPVSMAELTYDIPFFDNNRRTGDHMDIISINAYYGWYYGKHTDIGSHLDKLHSLFPDKPIIMSEFGAAAAPGRSEADGVWKADRVAWGKTYSEEYQGELIESYLKQIIERPFVRGLSPWVLSDFYNTWFPENPVPNYNLKGITSKERKPKRAFHFLKDAYSRIK